MSETRKHTLGVLEYLLIVVLGFFFLMFYDARTEMIERTASMAKNYDVVSLFLNHSPSQGVITTDGERLRSYGIVIARWDGDEIVMPDSSIFHSITTTKHRNLVRAMALSRGIIVKELE